jgi:hypothetical protein
VATTRAHADVLMILAAEQGFGLRVEQGRVLRGWAIAMQRHAADGVAKIHEGLETQHSVGPKSYTRYFPSLLMEACV